MIRIRFTKRVVFKDRLGNIVKVYEAGDEVNASQDTGAYYVTLMGGIWRDEAVKI